MQLYFFFILDVCLIFSSDDCQFANWLDRIITDDVIKEYEQNGVIVLRNMIYADILSVMHEPIRKAMSNPSEDHSEQISNSGGRFFCDDYLFRRLPIFQQFIFEQTQTAEIAARILKSEQVNLLYDQLFVKENMTDIITPWHQDQSYWAVEGNDVISIWIPFDHIPQEISPEFILGSHLWGNGREYIPFRFMNDMGNMKVMPNINELRDGDEIEIENHGISKIISFELNVGDILIFNGGILHGAPGNTQSINERRALAVRWLGDDVKYIKKQNPMDVIPMVPTQKYDSKILNDGDYIRNDPNAFPVGYGLHPDAPPIPS